MSLAFVIILYMEQVFKMYLLGVCGKKVMTHPLKKENNSSFLKE